MALVDLVLLVLLRLTFGKSVTSIESRETKATLLTTLSDFYAFENDIITQETTGATGEVIRDISEELTVAQEMSQERSNLDMRLIPQPK